MSFTSNELSDDDVSKYAESCVTLYDYGLTEDEFNENYSIQDLYRLILKGTFQEVKEVFEKVLKLNEDNIDEETESDENDYENDDDDEENIDDINHEHKQIEFVDRTTPIVVAAKLARYELLEYVINIDDSYVKKIYDDMTLLLHVCSSKLQEGVSKEDHKSNVEMCLKLLIDKKADINATTYAINNSALHLLAANDLSDLCGLLIEAGINIDIRNEQLNTPIMISSALGHYSTAEYLKGMGADITLKNRLGHSASDLALMNGHYNIVELLSGPDYSNKSRFIYAWSLIHNDLIDGESKIERYRSEQTKFLSKSHFASSSISSLCSSLNLPHLAPIFDHNKVTIQKLRNMSDTEMKRIGISRYSDRKTLLQIFQEVHKTPWNNITSLTAPDYKTSLKPRDLNDFIVNTNEHLEIIGSSLGYINGHFNTNPQYYIYQTKLHSGFISNLLSYSNGIGQKCQSIQSTLSSLLDIFAKIHREAFDDDSHTDFDVAQEHQLLDKCASSSICTNAQFTTVANPRRSILLLGFVLVVGSASVVAIASKRNAF